MGEGLSPTEVGKEIAEHRDHARAEHRADLISIVEAVLLATVALFAGWTGYASAKWSTESRLLLAQSSTARSQGSRADLAAMETRNFDASTFNAWFSAYVAGNQQAMATAERRFRPEFQVAFDAWRATDPETDPNAPKGPTFMPEYKQPDAVRAAALDAKADEKYTEGQDAGTNADDYVRIAVYLATVLFLVGISGHFRLKGARYGLVTVGVIVLVVADRDAHDAARPALSYAPVGLAQPFGRHAVTILPTAVTRNSWPMSISQTANVCPGLAAGTRFP